MYIFRFVIAIDPASTLHHLFWII